MLAAGLQGKEHFGAALSPAGKRAESLVFLQVALQCFFNFESFRTLGTRKNIVFSTFFSEVSRLDAKRFVVDIDGFRFEVFAAAGAVLGSILIRLQPIGLVGRWIRFRWRIVSLI